MRAGVLAIAIVLLAPSRASADEPAPAPSPAPAPPAPPDVTTAPSPPVADAVPAPQGPGGAPTIERSPLTDRPVFSATDKNRLVIGSGGHFAYGSAPAVALGVRVSAEVVSPRYSLALEGRYDLPSSGRTRPGARARSSLAGAAIVPCVRARAVWACGVVLLSRVSAEASESDGTRVSDAAFFLGVGGRLQAHFGLPWNFALRFSGDVLVHPIAYELRANDQRLLRSSVVSFAIGPMLVHAF